jgi:hypothetical protein
VGALGSGNFCVDKKAAIEACLRLDLRQLTWLGAVQPGARRQGILHWPTNAHRDAPATIGYVADLRDAPVLQLRYGVKSLEQAAQPVEQLEYVVPLTRTPLHYGGAGRWWWQCPLVCDGQACARRAQALYLPLLEGARYFGCQYCHRLTYGSRQSRWPTWQREWPAVTVEDVDRVEARILRACQ